MRKFSSRQELFDWLDDTEKNVVTYDGDKYRLHYNTLEKFDKSDSTWEKTPQHLAMLFRNYTRAYVPEVGDCAVGSDYRIEELLQDIESETCVGSTIRELVEIILSRLPKAKKPRKPTKKVKKTTKKVKKTTKKRRAA